MDNIEQHYFKNTNEWRSWLLENHTIFNSVYLIFYKKGHGKQSMEWEEAVKVALCFGWIDSTVKSLGEGKRQQYFSKRKPKGTWSKVNKKHIVNLIQEGSMHASGLEVINTAKQNGSWIALDDVENGIIPKNLKKAFNEHPGAYNNYLNFTFSQRKSYLYWLNQAKREDTKQKRTKEIIILCAANIKQRNNQ